ncbi:MAG: thiosulfohydrolase SoxB, partial [Gammaproteobacteria bacterium]|nr:thiosulfohydrolase SoxB [Gammaproteobacteria bacterium]
MPPIDRREFLKMLGVTAATSGLIACGKADNGTAGTPEAPAAAASGSDPLAGFYDLPMQGNARILHITDVHGQLNPVYFREPNVNLGVGDAFGRPPHVVGKGLLDYMGLKTDSPEAYAYTYIDFDNAARKYGMTGGFAHVKTLLDRLREQAGGRANTLTIDGGDLWQGSGTSLWTRGVDMVEASNILGLDVMVGHWEFTYREDEVLSNVALFKGDFIGQNVRVKEDSLFGDEYASMVEKFDGRGLYNEDSGHAFRPYVIKNVGGARICVVGQAFPRTANANPQEFFPDWSFGLREDDMIELVEEIRADEKPDAVVLLSHNGMDVDIKMAERVPGLNAVFGGHTHDGIPKPVEVKNVEGNTCYVTN